MKEKPVVPWIAGLWNFVLPGAGALYAGAEKKAFVHLVLFQLLVFCSVFVFLLAPRFRPSPRWPL